MERTDTLVLLMRNAVGWRMRRILGFDEKEEECRLTNEPQLCYIYMYISLRFLSSFFGSNNGKNLFAREFFVQF